MIASICIISLLLQSVLSNFLSTPSTFLHPLFSISAIILIYPYFKNKNYYFLVSFMYGICYDILFSEMLFINSLLFLLLAIIINILNSLWNNNLINAILFQIICIFFYQTTMYFLVSIITNIKWNSMVCFSLILNSLLANIIYIIIGYLLVEKISEKLKIDRIY